MTSTLEVPRESVTSTTSLAALLPAQPEDLLLFLTQ
jgi:hypothetical protein